MTNQATDTSPQIYARGAGLFALATLVAGSFAMSVNTRLVVQGDAATTATNIQASESLFRLGIVGALTMYVVFIPYVLALYKLLKPVNRDHAGLMVVLALVGVPIGMLNEINHAIALLLLNGTDYLQGFSADQIHGQVALFLKLHSYGGLIGGIFWGLWLFPLGLLVFRSGYLPRILGVFLMIGCFGWLILVLQRFVFPDYEALANARFAGYFAELLWVLWLLIKGVDVEKWKERAAQTL